MQFGAGTMVESGLVGGAQRDWMRGSGRGNGDVDRITCVMIYSCEPVRTLDVVGVIYARWGFERGEFVGAGGSKKRIANLRLL